MHTENMLNIGRYEFWIKSQTTKQKRQMQPREFSDLGQVLHKKGHKEYLTFSSTEMQRQIQMWGKVLCKPQAAVQVL